MDDARLAAEIANVEALLDQIAAAIASLADPTVQSYSLDSGQSVERVTRNSLRDLIASQNSLRNSLATLCARQTGNGATLVIPSGPLGGGRW